MSALGVRYARALMQIAVARDALKVTGGFIRVAIIYPRHAAQRFNNGATSRAD